MENEQELIIKALHGDNEAFGSLVKQYRAEAYTIAFSIVQNHLDTEELMQEAFIKAYLNLSELHNPERFGAWLKSIIRNICKDWLRKRMQPFLPIDDMLNDQQLTLPPADENILKNEHNDALSESLSSLTYDDRKILKLYYVYEFGYEEIIRANRQSYSAVTSRLHKAKNKLKDAIGNQPSPFMTDGLLMALSGGFGDMRIGLGKSQDVLDAIKTVEYAQSTESSRYFLNGIHIESTREFGLRMVATDGKRMVVAQLPVNDNKEEFSAIVLRDEIDMLKEALQQENADVSMEKIDESTSAFYVGNDKKLIRLNNGKFPDYNKAIPKNYAESIALKRQAIIDIMEKIVDESKEHSPSDWIQKGNTIYVSSADQFTRQIIKNRAAELCHKLLEFIVHSNSSEELNKSIFNHLPKDEYENLLSELEKQKGHIDASKPLGQLNIINSNGSREFICRINGRFMLDAVRAMKGNIVKIHYQMGDGTTIPSIALLNPIKLTDETNNIHVIMPMMA